MRVRAVAVVAVIVGVLAAMAGPASAAQAYAGDFPDPFVMNVAGIYWAYATGHNSNLQVMSSSDLTHWGGVADPLPRLPGWALPGLTWAPGVLARGSGFVMYYTVTDGASGRQCISIATSSSPGGPYTDGSSRPFICQINYHGGSIDPNPFVAPDGTAYLLWKSDDNAVGRPTHLWGQQLSATGLSLVGTPVVLLSQKEAWQSPAIEGPSMIAVAGVYYLFYGGGNWNSVNASIGYATCASPLGRCTNRSTTKAWMVSHGDAKGPSGPSPFIDAGGAIRLAYHAWTIAVGYPQGGVRSLWIDALSFVKGVPAVS